VGAFSAKFSTTPSGKTIDGTQKSIRPKMMASTQNLVEIARRTAAWEDEMWCFSLFLFISLFFTGRICRRQLCRYCFYSRANFWVFRPAGATRWTDPCEIWQGGADRRSAPPCQISPWSVQRWGFTAPKTEKNRNFTNIIAHKGRLPCTIFTQFTRFMRVHSLHNFAKFGSFISINDKIINNLLRWGVFSQIFDDP